MTDSTPLAPPTPPCLEARGLGAWRRGRVQLDEVTFTLAAGKLGALFGPRSAGQTAVFEILAGRRRATTGTAWLDGASLAERRAALGVVFAQPCRDRRTNVEQHLLLAARLYGLRGLVARDRAMELLAFIELGDRRDEPVTTLPRELAWRLELARALIHRPRLLLIDEPGAGLGTAARARFWRLLLALRRSQQLAMLVTTDRPTEAERCDHVVLMDRGRVLAEGPPATLIPNQGQEMIVLEVDSPERLAAQLSANADLTVSVRDGQLVLITPGGETLLAELITAIGKDRIRSATIRRPTLADAFADLTGRGLDDDGGGP